MSFEKKNCKTEIDNKILGRNPLYKQKSKSLRLMI